MNTFAWLLKREYWEHRGGFLWAPVWTSGIFLVLILLALILAEVTAGRMGVNISGIPFNTLTQQIGANEVAKLNAGMDIGLLSLSFPIAIVLFFVVFFYLLGALYDDRRDRSVLFWKSLPLSDQNTVLSKILAAALLAPVLALGAAIALHLGFLILVSGYALLHGVNPFPLFWSPIHLISLWLKLLVMVPVNALWALPSIGWLLLCSSYVRSKPFIWAVAVPVIAGVAVSFVHLMQELSLPSMWFWKNIVGRALLSTFPGSWLDPSTLKALDGADESTVQFTVSHLLSFGHIANALASADLWIGAAAGTAMIAGAVYFRRVRTEAYS